MTHLRLLSIALISTIATVLVGSATLVQAANSQSAFEEIAARAQSAREAGRTEEAIREYQGAVKLRPDWQEGWWYLGTLAYDADRYADAIPALRKFVDLNPQIGAAWGFLGLSEFETKEYESSRTHLAKAEELGYAEGPEVAKVARYHLALLLNLHREFEKAEELLAAESGRGKLPEQIQVALGIALLRIPLLPAQIDPGRDALVHAAGEAAALLVGGNAEGAAEKLRQIIAGNARLPYVRLALAAALTMLDRNAEAQQQLLEEAQLTPSSPLPYLRLASLSLVERHPEEAVKHASRAVQVAPRLPAAHEALARALSGAGKTAESAEETRVAVSLTPSSVEPDAAPTGLYANGVGLPDSAATTSGESVQFEQLAREAATHRARGETEAAMLAYQEALRLQPQWKEGWWWWGALSYASGHHPDAVRALQNVVKFDPGRGEAWALLGLSEFETKDYPNALIHLQRGRQLGLKGDAAAVRTTLYHLGLVLVHDSQFDEAMDALIPQAGSGPYEEQIHLAMGLALLRMPLLEEQIPAERLPLVRETGEAAALLARSKYDQAFPILQRLLEQYPNTPYLHYAYGVSLASLSRFEEAEVQLREETKIATRSALPYLRLASVALQTHRPDSALEYAQRAAELSPGSAKAHYVLGRTWLELGKTEKAIAELETARDMTPNSPEVHFNLARAYAKAGRADAAAQERAIFEKLNAQAEQQRSAYGSRPANAAEANPATANPNHD